MCGSGMTFRESFLSWKRKSHAVSMEDVIIDELPLLQRRMSNDAFKIYLQLMAFPVRGVLAKLSSCRTWQSLMEGGSSKWEAVIMDGTVTGILKKLPRFQRPTEIFPSMKSTSHLQFILQTKMQRDFLDAIFMSAKRKKGISYSSQSIHNLYVRKSSVRCLTSWSQPHIGRARATLLLFAISCFLVYQRWRNLIHKIKDLDAYRNTIEFARWFISGSIPGGVLRNKKSADAVHEFIECTHNFPSSSHETKDFIANLVVVSTTPC